MKKYREVSDNNSRSGHRRQTMPFLREMERICGRRPAIQRPHGLDMDNLDMDHDMSPPNEDVFGELMQRCNVIIFH